MAALDALVDVPEIRYIVTRHEQATTYMADGYARATGRPGVAMVVPGVGVYNAASGLATAYACSSPVLLLAGQVNRDGIGRDLGLLHDVHDQLDIVRPVTTSATRVLHAADIPTAVREAPRAADAAALDKAAAVLSGASSPLVVAGGGVVLGDAAAALTALAERLQAPVVTTREGKGAI